MAVTSKTYVDNKVDNVLNLTNIADIVLYMDSSTFSNFNIPGPFFVALSNLTIGNDSAYGKWGFYSKNNQIETWVNIYNHDDYVAMIANLDNVKHIQRDINVCLSTPLGDRVLYAKIIDTSGVGGMAGLNLVVPGAYELNNYTVDMIGRLDTKSDKSNRSSNTYVLAPLMYDMGSATLSGITSINIDVTDTTEFGDQLKALPYNIDFNIYNKFGAISGTLAFTKSGRVELWGVPNPPFILFDSNTNTPASYTTPLPNGPFIVKTNLRPVPDETTFRTMFNKVSFVTPAYTYNYGTDIDRINNTMSSLISHYDPTGGNVGAILTAESDGIIRLSQALPDVVAEIGTTTAQLATTLPVFRRLAFDRLTGTDTHEFTIHEGNLTFVIMENADSPGATRVRIINNRNIECVLTGISDWNNPRGTYGATATTTTISPGGNFDLFNNGGRSTSIWSLFFRLGIEWGSYGVFFDEIKFYGHTFITDTLGKLYVEIKEQLNPLNIT